MANPSGDMQTTLDTSQLLMVVIALLARGAFPEGRLRSIISPSGRSDRHVAAYNLCDGTRSRPQVYKAAGLDKDNFNKTIKKWIQQGVLFEIQKGDRPVLLRLYQLPPQDRTARSGDAST